MKVLMSHPTGNQNVRAAVIGLANEGLVESFNTTIASFPDDWMDQLSKLESFSDLSRRRYDTRIQSVTRAWPWLEVARLIAMKTGIKSLTRHECGPFSIDAVYRNLDQRVANQLMKKRERCAVYAYEDGAYSTFKTGREIGMTCLYDLPIGYWRSGIRILSEEKEKWPAWANTMPGLHNSNEKLQRKDQELAMADQIMVASSFTARTLQEYPGELAPIHIIPYGFPPAMKDVVETKRNTNGPLRILFVGGLSQRKGLAYLFAAARKFSRHICLTLIGKKPLKTCRALETELRHHTWIPGLAHQEILAAMRSHDVLVFPTLFEGFGLVITEAMSQGTPVITTDRTAGPDFINHGRNGWLVEAGSTDALEKSFDELLTRPALMKDVGREALLTARSRPWEVYGEELANTIKSILNPVDNVLFRD